jgi:cytochrome b561
MTNVTELNRAIYDATTIRLHWATAIAFAILWIIGQTADYIPHGPVNTAVWSVHVVLGFCLVALLIYRVYWRAAQGRRLPPADRGALQVAAKSTHYLLYVLLAVVVTLGVVNAFVRGYNLFDLVSLPQVGDKALRRPITHWHGLIANITLALIGLHAAAALAHRYLWGDGVLARMAPRAKLTAKSRV